MSERGFSQFGHNGMLNAGDKQAEYDAAITQPLNSQSSQNSLDTLFTQMSLAQNGSYKSSLQTPENISDGELAADQIVTPGQIVLPPIVSAESQKLSNRTLAARTLGWLAVAGPIALSYELMTNSVASILTDKQNVLFVALTTGVFILGGVAMIKTLYDSLSKK